MIFNQLRGSIGSVDIVVSPLIALMKDQVESFKSKGLESAFLVLDVEFVQLPSFLGGADIMKFIMIIAFL